MAKATIASAEAKIEWLKNNSDIKDIMTGDIISFSSQLTDWLKEEWLLGYEEFVTDENTNMDGYQQCTGQ